MEIIITIIVIIFVIIIRHQSGLNKLVSASSNSLCRGHPIRLRPFGLQFNIPSATLPLFILVTCRNQLVLYRLGYS